MSGISPLPPMRVQPVTKITDKRKNTENNNSQKKNTDKSFKECLQKEIEKNKQK